MPKVTPVGRFVARLADGGESEGRVDPAAVAKWCQRNKYPLLALAAGAPAWLRESAPFRDALLAERASYELQRDEYCIVRDAWLERGIPCLMIKSAGNAPSFPHTSDNIDILVPPAQGEAARDTLRELGYVELRHIEEPQKYLFRRFRAGQSVSAIHVHEQVGWLVGFMDEADLWSRRIVSGDDATVTIPSPEDAVLINVAHACYENKILRFNDILRVRHALRARGAAFDWGYLERVAASRGWLDGLAYMVLVYDHLESLLFGDALLPEGQRARFARIAAADRYTQQRLAEIRAMSEFELPLDLSYKYCKWLYYRKILGDPQMPRFRRWADVATTLRHGIRLKAGIRPQPGMTIAVSGPDGAGKTTHAQALVETLRFCGIKTDYVWNRGGSTGLLKAVSRLRRRLPGRTAPATPAREDGVTRRQRQLRHPATRFAWSWLVAFDQISTYLWRVHLPARFGRVVVADRYAYDTAVEMDATLPRDDRWSRLAIRAMLRFAPRPQAAFMLAVPQAIAEARRHDEVWGTEPEIERERYRTLAADHQLRVVPNDGTFAESNDAIFRAVMADYMVDFGTPLNGLFGCNPDQKNRPDTVWRCAETRRAIFDSSGFRVPSSELSSRTRNPEPGTRNYRRGGLMKVLIVTNMYPTKERPSFGTFVKDQVNALRAAGVDVDVFFFNGRRSKLEYLTALPHLWWHLLRHRYDLIHAHYVLAGVIARAQLGHRVVLTHHGGEALGHQPFQARLCRWLTPLCDETIHVTDEIRRAIGDDDGWVIPCGVDLDHFSPQPRDEARRQLGLPLNKPLVLFAGEHWRPEKQFWVVKAAMARVQEVLPEAELVLLTGKPHATVPAYMAACDALVLTSSVEGSPMVVKEAMAMNLPVVAVRVGDVPEVIGETPGCALAERDPADVATKLLGVLRRPQRTDGRARIEHMRHDRIAQRIIEVYRKAMQPRRNARPQSVEQGEG